MVDHASWRDAVLSEAEATQQLALLDRLGAELDKRGIGATISRKQRLVLRYNDASNPRSGLTAPILYMRTSMQMVHVRTNGTSYILESETLPMLEPAAAALRILSTLADGETPIRRTK